MITVTFYKNDRLVLGVKTNRGVLDIEAAYVKFPYINNIPKTVFELVTLGETAKQGLQRLIEHSLMEDDLFYKEDSLNYGPCIPKPEKIICIGLNYKKHAIECKMPFPSAPILFGKFNNTINAHGKDIFIPTTSSQVDYEAELAIVIGRKAKNIKTENALSIVYGYCAANDVSARDLQNKSSQWMLGKTSDGFCPIGPNLVSKEEVENPNNLKITLSVNEEIRQDSNTSDMIFSCEELVSYVSKHLTLQPGDIILTGTPEGVILGYAEDKKVWLKDGDAVTVEIEKLGKLTNIFRREQTDESVRSDTYEVSGTI
ncbi:fumarylacetoacetate hydrolase family protein [Bacillus salipaludis]|uniref:fumarylacetoacetate hydrolase family protein n=1 Tax=Bacillus salipaludis TaxID=2547811 RepID=UPI002E229BB8|nr:fumarylacetoacetate hydrolase family protein [Bacillus salipaludis]